jgi:hypothetical protein
LHDHFFTILQSLRDRDKDQIVDMFFQAFNAVLPYLSSYQIAAVRELRTANEGAAVAALFDNCLIEIVRLWQYSPVFGSTEIFLTRRDQPGPVNSYEDVQYDNILLIELRAVRDRPDLSRRFLDAFATSANSELPLASDIFFYGGLFIPLTVVDLVIARHLHQRSSSPAAVPDGALEAAFRICSRTMYYPSSSHKVSEPTEVGDEITLKTLEECRAVHESLRKLSGGLKWFNLIGQSARHLQPLHCQSLVDRLLTLDPRLPMSQFSSAQVLQFARRQFLVYARQLVVKEIEQQEGSNATKYIERELTRCLAGHRDMDLAEAVFAAAGDVVTEWKKRKGQSNTISPPSKVADVPLCRYFLECADALAAAYFRQRVSRMHWGISGVPPGGPLDIRSQIVDQFLKFNVDSPSAQSVSVLDRVARKVMAQAGPASFLLLAADGAFREQFVREFDVFRFGATLDLVLEIEAALTPLLDTDAFSDSLQFQRAILQRICDGVELRYVKWNILRALALVESAEMGGIQEFPDVHIHGKRVIECLRPPLERLRAWFELRSGALKLPGLGQL